MKKALTFLIAAILVLSMIPCTALPVLADDEVVYPEPDDDFWSTVRDPKEYNKAEDEAYKPTAGFKYTSEGFVTIPPSYAGTGADYSIQSSYSVDLSEGFYMQFRIDDFSYKGDDGKQDEWISISIADSRFIAQANVDWNNNWFSLLRGNGDGNATLESYITTKTTDEKKGVFSATGGTSNISVPLDENGKEVYEFEVVKTNSGYSIRINGVEVNGSATVGKHISAFDYHYISISFHTGQVDGTAACTILKQGTSKADAEVPEGTAEKEPEENLYTFADIADPSTVAENQPALLFDPNKTSFLRDPQGVHMTLVPTGSGTYHISASAADPYFNWTIKNSLSYEANDFPVWAILLKNYWGNDGTLYYCAGNIVSSTPDYMVEWSAYDENALSYSNGEDIYTLVIVDLHDKWEGRISNLRVDFRLDTNDPDSMEWGIDYMGMFRSVEEAQAYANAYAAEHGMADEATSETETETEAESVADTNSDTQPESESDASADTIAEQTIADTVAEQTTADTAPVDPTDSGCASVIGVSAAAVLLMAAWVARKKM